MSGAVDRIKLESEESSNPFNSNSLLPEDQVLPSEHTTHSFDDDYVASTSVKGLATISTSEPSFSLKTDMIYQNFVKTGTENDVDSRTTTDGLQSEGISPPTTTLVTSTPPEKETSFLPEQAPIIKEAEVVSTCSSHELNQPQESFIGTNIPNLGENRHEDITVTIDRSNGTVSEIVEPENQLEREALPTDSVATKRSAESTSSAEDHSERLVEINLAFESDSLTNELMPVENPIVLEAAGLKKENSSLLNVSDTAEATESTPSKENHCLNHPEPNYEQSIFPDTTSSCAENSTILNKGFRSKEGSSDKGTFSGLFSSIDGDVPDTVLENISNTSIKKEEESNEMTLPKIENSCDLDDEELFHSRFHKVRMNDMKESAVSLHIRSSGDSDAILSSVMDDVSLSEGNVVDSPDRNILTDEVTDLKTGCEATENLANNDPILGASKTNEVNGDTVATNEETVSSSSLVEANVLEMKHPIISRENEMKYEKNAEEIGALKIVAGTTQLLETSTGSVEVPLASDSHQYPSIKELDVIKMGDSQEKQSICAPVTVASKPTRDDCSASLLDQAITGVQNTSEEREPLKDDQILTLPISQLVLLSPSAGNGKISCSTGPTASGVETENLAVTANDAPSLLCPLNKAIDSLIDKAASPSTSEQTAVHLEQENLIREKKIASETDLTASPRAKTEVTNSLILHQQVESLSSQLLRAQTQLESLLEEKQRWLVSSRSSQSKESVNAEKAALVVKFAQSEQMRMKAESRVRELEKLLSQKALFKPATEFSIANTHSSPDSQPIEELNKALADAREKAEHWRYSLKQEGIRVNDVSTKLNAAREAHRSEQKRAAALTEALNKSSRDIDILKRQLKEADRVREREAKRLCQEVANQDIAEKYQKLVAENMTLQHCIISLQEAAKEHLEVQVKMKELQASYDELLGVREELEYCQRRETQLSEFTRRLTERNAGLQADYLAAQSRLEATETAVKEARHAAEVTLQLAQQADERLQQERDAACLRNASLESRLAEVTASEASLRASLAAERDERNTLRRKQNALDRELARLLAHSRKVTNAPVVPSESALDSAPEDELKIASSNASLDTNPPILPTTPLRSDSLDQIALASEELPPALSPVVIGDAMMASGYDQPLLTNAEQHHHPETGCPLSSDQQASEVECPPIQTVEPSKHLLLAKISKLQRINARLMEKIDFMRDHIEQLTSELQKKTLLLQYHFLNGAADAGSAAPINVDENKMNTIRRGGGLMASVFAGQAVDGQADLKISLQINQKLQTVLEDTLYKNITLKENLDTLADEVDRVTRANRELKELLVLRTELQPLSES